MTDPLTIAVTAALVAVAIVYDVWTLASWNALLVARRWPIIPLALGVVIGHLYWSNRAADCFTPTP